MYEEPHRSNRNVHGFVRRFPLLNKLCEGSDHNRYSCVILRHLVSMNLVIRIATVVPSTNQLCSWRLSEFWSNE
jgi:hypothetical protein